MYLIYMERHSKIARLLAGIASLEHGEHSYSYNTNGRELACRIDQLMSKRLMTSSAVSLDHVVRKFQSKRLLEEEELGKKSGEVAISGGGEYVLKLVTMNDLRKLEKIVDDYVKYVTASPQTLLARILRVFTMKTLDFDTNDAFILMQSVRPAGKHVVFDVKGCIEGRWLAEEGIVSTSFGRDQDLLDSKYLLVLQENSDRFGSVLKQLGEDTRFLLSHNIMDYSLLISFSEEQTQLPGSVQLSDGTYCTLGLIDYLQEYNMVKKMEGAFKGLFKNASELSSVDSQKYSERMIDFVLQKIFAKGSHSH